MVGILTEGAAIAKDVAIKLEFAETPEALAWGLMGRDHLDKDSGMLFIYKAPTILSFWMYNTFIDLSIAFMDEERVIREIHDMFASPEKMKRHLKPEELKNLSSWDPAVAFFLKRQIFSSFPVKFALEVNRGWFEKNGIGIGDKLEWAPGQAQGRCCTISHRA